MMHRDNPNLEPGNPEGPGEARRNRSRRDALDVLLEARDQLISQLADEIRSQKEALLDGSAQSVFGFEFQEIEDRYSARLHALNSILENLEYRRPRLAHKIETLSTTRARLKADLNALVSQFDQWDLVDVSVTPIENELLVVVSFTADEYGD